MSDPRQAKVWGKKSEIADRTLNERKYCKLCDYYYSEMFTCPICFGADRERERIIKIIEKHFIENDEGGTGYCQGCDWKNSYAVGFDDHLIALIKGEQK